MNINKYKKKKTYNFSYNFLPFIRYFFFKYSQILFFQLFIINHKIEF